MTLSINAKTYTQDSFGTNTIGYTGPAHTGSVKDYVRLARTAARATDSFSGQAKSQAKMTRTLTLTAAKTATGDSIFDVNAAIPVGFAGADVDTMCNDMGAWIASTAFKNLLKSQLINQ